jgi:tetratricopeptide (TPR) repeat protein
MHFRTLAPARLALLILLAASLGCATVSRGPLSQDSTAPDLNRDPARAEAYYHYLAAQMRLDEDNFEGALTDFERAIELEPKSLSLKGEMTQLFLRRGDLQEALKWAKQLVAEQPEDVASRLVLGGIYSGLGMDPEAIEQYERVRVIDPKNPDALLVLGALYGRQHDYGKAEEVLNALVKAAPDSFMGYYYLGRLGLESNSLAAAERSYLKALDLKPMFENAMIDLAFVYERRGDVAKAMSTYDRILTANPTSRVARGRLGRLYLLNNRYDDALAQFQEMKRLGQYDQDVRIEVGLIYLEQDKVAEAIKELNQVLAEDPANERVKYYLATCYEEKGDLTEAQRLFREVGEGSDAYMDAQVHLAFILQKQDKLPEAEAVVRHAIERLPSEPRLKLFLGALLEARQRYADALVVLKEGLALDPKSTDILFRIGVVLDKFHDQDGCIERMKEVIGLDAQHASALNYLGYTYADRGIKLDEAETLVKRALAIRPGDGYITDSLAWVYYKQKRYPLALKEMEKAVALVKEDPVISEHLGDVCAAMGLEERALAAYKRALELNHEDKAAIQGKISRIEKDKRRKADAQHPAQ